MLGLPEIQYFLPVFLPSVEGIKNKEGREFFIKLIKPIKPEQVKAEMDPISVQSLNEYDGLDPDHAMKKLRKEIKEIEADLLYIEGQMDVLKEKAEMPVPEPVSTKEIEEQLEEVEKQLYTQVVQPPKLHDTSKLEREIMQLELELEKTPTPPKLKDTFQLERELKEKREEYLALRRKKQRLKLPFKKGDECPTCLQKIRDLSKLQANLQRQIKDIDDDLTALKEIGQLTREELEAVIRENEETLKRFEKAEEDRKQKVQKLIDARKEELKQLIEENKKILEEFETRRNNDYLTELEEKREHLKKQLDNIRAINTKRELLLTEKAQAQESIDKLGQMKRDHLNTIQSHKERIKALQHYNEVYVRLLNEQIKGQFKRVSLKLFEVNKETGELKDIFEVLYDNKPVHVLSFSERIRAGLELAAFVQKQLGILLPTFIDNAESITYFDDPPGQLFTAGVVKGKKLEVTVMVEKNDESVGEQLSLGIG